MSGIDPENEAAVVAGIVALAAARRYRLTTHVVGRMALHGIALAELFEALTAPLLLENYPTFYQGPAALVYGDTAASRPIHVVCSTTLPELVFVTVYEPRPPKWLTPTQRG